MSEPTIDHTTMPTPLDTFIERAEARGLLWSIGELDLSEAVDALRAFAVSCGLVNMIGQDRVQQIITDAFVGLRMSEPKIKWEDLERRRRQLATLGPLWEELNDPRQHPTPPATVEAIMFAVRQRGLGALKEPANEERLLRCDEAAMKQIRERIERMREKDLLSP
jgi:hypothetical protein